MAGEAEPIRFGILGCAEIARKVSRAITLSPNATLCAVGSRSLEKASKFAASNGFPPHAKVYGSYEGVLDDPDVDAVYVPLPTSLHVHWAVLAAQKKKHLLLEKPVALNVEELDKILDACQSNGLQFMDATMWMHHPRTSKMFHFLSDPHQFGRLQSVHATFSYGVSPYFLENDIRMKPDLDALGTLGDTGWYCVRAILWATNYELPKTARALHKPTYNEAGVILACWASLSWEDDKVATFYCSFLTDMSMDIIAMGTKGSLRVHDYVIPNQEKEATFSTSSNSDWVELARGWAPTPIEHIVHTDLIPQEALMVKEFAHLVGAIKYNNSKPEDKWPTISRKTQVVIDAVKASIDNGLEPVQIQETFRMAVYGLLILGPSQHMWFNCLSKILPNRDVATTLKKIFMGQAVFGPVINTVFFSYNGAVQGESGAEIIIRLKRDLLPTLLGGAMFWPVCDFVTFKFIPVHLQPLVNSSCAYLWTIYLTYMANRKNVITA